MRAFVIASMVLAASLSLLSASAVNAEPTEITVRVLSRNAKFVGTSMGGASVILRDADTGEVLARGVTSGGTGNTRRIMHESGGRRATLSDESAAKFVATIDIDEPRLIEAEIYGPLAQRQSANRVTATHWVVPGRDLSGGDGWVLELPGFVVDVLAPPAHIKLPPDTNEVGLRANVTLMCGCPIVPGGLWDADALEVTALVKRNGKRIPSVGLTFSGEASQFSGTVPITGAGVYDVTVYAHNPATGNTGVDRTTFVIGRK